MVYVICAIAWLTMSWMVTPVADCLHEEVSPGIVKGGIVSDEKLGIVNYGCSINPYTM